MVFELILAKNAGGIHFIRDLYIRLYFGRDYSGIPLSPIDEISVNRSDAFLIRCAKAIIEQNDAYRQSLMIFRLDDAYAFIWSIKTNKFTYSDEVGRTITETFEEISLGGDEVGPNALLVDIPDARVRHSSIYGNFSIREF